MRGSLSVVTTRSQRVENLASNVTSDAWFTGDPQVAGPYLIERIDVASDRRLLRVTYRPTGSVEGEFNFDNTIRFLMSNLS